jgi:hypothetical protein
MIYQPYLSYIREVIIPKKFVIKRFDKEIKIQYNVIVINYRTGRDP